MGTYITQMEHFCPSISNGRHEILSKYIGRIQVSNGYIQWRDVDLTGVGFKIDGAQCKWCSELLPTHIEDFEGYGLHE
jgi:hypothetical protein